MIKKSILNTIKERAKSLGHETQEKKGETASQKLSKLGSHRFKKGKTLKGIIL